MGSNSLLSLANPGAPFDLAWIDLAPQSASFDSDFPPATAEDMRTIASLLDLTSLNSDDTDAKILLLFDEALDPLQGLPPKGLPPRVGEVRRSRDGGERAPTVAGICIYPQFLGLAGTWVRHRGVRLVTVAGDFPHALAPLDSRCREVTQCAKLADEVDIPMDRRLILENEWEELYWETRELVRAAHNMPVKLILGTGELPNQQTIYRAATIAMMAGATFIKTSTGKERVNARLDAGAIMCRAIRDYEKRTGHRVGLKPAGGIRTTNEAMSWLHLARTKLGEEWISPDLFRIGASTLLEHLRYSLDSDQ